MVFAAVVALVLGQVSSPKPLTTPMTASWKAQSTPMVVSKLAAETGHNLTVAPGMENRILLVHVKDVPLSTVLDKVAAAAEANWQLVGDSLQLTPSPSSALSVREIVAKNIVVGQKRMEEAGKEEPDARLIEFAKRYRKLAPVVEADEYSEKETVAKGTRATEFKSLQSRIPSRRTSARVFRGLDPALLASIPIGGKLAFTAVPNKSQLKMPSNIANILKEFERRHRIWSLHAKGDKIPKDWFLDPYGEMDWSPTDSAEEYDSTDTQLKRILIVRRNFDPVSFAKFTIQYFATVEGQLIWNDPFFFEESVEPFQFLTEDLGKKIEADMASFLTSLTPPKKPYSYSPETSSLYIGDHIPDQQMKRDAYRKVLPLFANATKVDPLQFGPSELYIQYLEETGLNGIFPLLDTAMGLGHLSVVPGFQPGRELVDGMLKFANGQYGNIMKVDSGWLTIGQRETLGVRFHGATLDRAALESSVKTYQELGQNHLLSKVSFGQFAFGKEFQNCYIANPLAQSMSVFLEQGFWFPQVDYLEALVFMSTFTREELEKILKGTTLKFGDLRPETQRAFKAFVHSDYSSPLYGGEEDPELTLIYGPWEPSRVGRLREESTEAFPDGIADSAEIQFRVQDFHIVKGYDEVDLKLIEVMNAERNNEETIGTKFTLSRFAMKLEDEKANKSLELQRYKAYNSGTSTMLQISAKLADSVHVRMWVPVNLKMQSLAPGPRTKLPADVMAAIEAERKLAPDREKKIKKLNSSGMEELVSEDPTR